MSPLFAALLLQTQIPAVPGSGAAEVGLTWAFPGTAKWSNDKYLLTGKTVKGEVYAFSSPNGHFDAEAMYQSDTKRTKEAAETKGFGHQKVPTLFAGILAISSTQHYLWNGAAVSSKCVYAAEGHRAWIVRLWWPTSTATASELVVESFLKSCRRTP